MNQRNNKKRINNIKICNQETESSSEKLMHPSFSWVKERKSEIFYGSIIVCSFFSPSRKLMF